MSLIPCRSCGVPTRKQRVPIAKAPGTRLRRGDQCKKCYDVDHPPKEVKDYKKLSRERAAAAVVDVRHTIIGLEGYMAERRTRLARKAS